MLAYWLFLLLVATFFFACLGHFCRDTKYGRKGGGDVTL